MMKKGNNNTDSNLNVGRVAEMLDDFFEGRTTLEEEQTLYEYFNGDDVNPLFERYSNLFRQIDGLNHKHRKLDVKALWNKMSWWGVSTAAMIALAFTLGSDLLTSPRPSEDFLALYEGSYVIENGRKITDLTTIMPKLHNVEAAASSMMVSTQVKINTDGMAPEMQETISEMLKY